MYGATMGVLNIDVTVDGGYTWTTLWTQSGNQGDQWLDAVVDLANYAGQIVQLRMNYTSGSSFTGDCAIDNLRVGELPAVGCTDPLANYDHLQQLTMVHVNILDVWILMLLTTVLVVM